MLQVTDGRCYGARWRTVTRKLPQWKFRNPETQRPAYGASPPANRAYPLQHPAHRVAYSASPPAPPTRTEPTLHSLQHTEYHTKHHLQLLQLTELIVHSLQHTEQHTVHHPRHLHQAE